jgi:hypothetical protein
MHAGGGPTEGVDGPRPPPSSRPYVRTGHSGPSSLPSGPHRPYAAAEPATPPQQRGLCLAKKPASISHHARARSRRARLAPTTPPTPPRPVSRSRARDDALRACACVRSEGGVTARRTVAQRRTYCGAPARREASDNVTWVCHDPARGTDGCQCNAPRGARYGERRLHAWSAGGTCPACMLAPRPAGSVDTN